MATTHGKGQIQQFVRQAINGGLEWAFNRVQLEDSSGNLITTLNPLPVQQPSAVAANAWSEKSTLNSSTATLGAGLSFTGTEEENNWPWIGSYCVTDQDGTLFFEFKDEGGTWRQYPPDGFEVSANIPEFHTAIKLPRPYRTRFVNGAVAQGSFNLMTCYGVFDQGVSPLNLSLSNDADARVVRVIEPRIDLELGRVGGQSVDSKFAKIIQVDIADGPKDLWDWASGDLTGVDQKTFPAAPTSFFIASDNAADTAVSVESSYIDANGFEQTVTTNLDGTDARTGVDLGISGIDINRARVVSSTAALGNIYIITANNFSAAGVPNVASEVVAFIRAGTGQTRQLCYTTPVDKTLVIAHFSVYLSRASGSAGSSDVQFLVKRPGENWVSLRPLEVTTSAPYSEDEYGLVFPGLTKYVVRVQDVSDNGSNLFGKLVYNLIGS